MGSGPGPTLSVMLTERGFPTEIWDPHFAPDPRPLERRWDFVTCTETVEHFRDPAASWGRLFALLKPGGWLAVMTEPFEPSDTEAAKSGGDAEAGTSDAEAEAVAAALDSWWYARDPTHVALHRPRTLEWVGARWRAAEVVRPSRTVVLYRAARG